MTAGRTTQLVSIELFVDDNVVKFGVPPLLPEVVIAVERCAEKRRRNSTACKCTFCEHALQMFAPINMFFADLIMILKPIAIITCTIDDR